ncbi:hypothetical protein GCM10007879_06870 [Maritalea porphyrae]|uniref:Uncharacterized protein n=1 Tax=Maritalea porphyrae TaxID=880732 RepID=A0ABQ5UMJ4_9HYPH|nr:hypothetical protein GCM10007879_06870 [Maritalea porphyrae]
MRVGASRKSVRPKTHPLPQLPVGNPQDFKEDAMSIGTAFESGDKYVEFFQRMAAMWTFETFAKMVPLAK